MNDLVGGRVTVAHAPTPVLIGLVRSGKLRDIAVTSKLEYCGEAKSRTRRPSDES